MVYYKFIIIVLVFRNVDDLTDCIKSIYNKIVNAKVIVVNSFYDKGSKEAIERVADDNNCVFINVENKGYSYGNNRGIEYARNHYVFDYLIVSNPDITISQFDELELDRNPEYGIFAPKIIARSGRLQNPMTIVRSRLSEWLEYKGFKSNSKLFIALGIGIGRIRRLIATVIHIYKDKPYRIYAAHGSFVILSKFAIDKLYPIYDENLFLFAEEGVLAYRAMNEGIKTGQFNAIVIYHKEDGSMKLSNLSINDELKKANLYYYENYVLGR